MNSMDGEQKTNDTSHAPTYNNPALLKYRLALESEMQGLRDKGGRRYKIVNGRFISKEIAAFVYGFEMESELHLSDDAPIRLQAGNEGAKGSVLACEEFQVMLTVDRNLGESVPVAYISVEPWKLLGALNDKLLTLGPEHHIAIKFLEEGPALATRKSIENVDRGQEQAIAHAMRDDITVIWGPPGTGKTHTMAEIAISYLRQGKTVLAVSHSNISVDGVTAKIAQLMREKGLNEALAAGQVLRYGYVRADNLADDFEAVSYNFALSRQKGLKEKMGGLVKEKAELKRTDRWKSKRGATVERELKKLRASVREEERACVLKARIVATTISKVYANKLFEDKMYDVVMFDEASMAYVPQVICAAMFAKQSLLCVGDFRQLAPISQYQRALNTDIFWYLGICDRTQTPYYHPWLVMLDEQRRMHPDISSFPSKTFYHGLLQNHSSILHARDAVVQEPPCQGSAMNLINLSGTCCTEGKNSDHSRFNILSAVIDLGLAITFQTSSDKEVGVIAPYAAQVRLVRAMVDDLRERGTDIGISCATVHQFQGSERDAVIFDAVECYPQKNLGILTSNNDNGAVSRLVNVAATRARGKLITVAHASYWETKAEDANNAFVELIKYQKRAKNCTVVDVINGALGNLISSLDYGSLVAPFVDMQEALRVLLKDIGRASSQITVIIPNGLLLAGIQEQILHALTEAKTRGVLVRMKCLDFSSLPDGWKRLGWASEDAACSLCDIDGKVIWQGVPPSRGVYSDKSGKGSSTVLQIPVRIRGKRTIELLESYTEIDTREVNNRRVSLDEKDAHGGKVGIDDGKENELGNWFAKQVTCDICKAPATLARGFTSGKYFLKCSNAHCDWSSLIDVGVLDACFGQTGAQCPTCGNRLNAKVGTYGIYARCIEGHNVNLGAITFSFHGEPNAKTKKDKSHGYFKADAILGNETMRSNEKRKELKHAGNNVQSAPQLLSREEREALKQLKASRRGTRIVFEDGTEGSVIDCRGSKLAILMDGAFDLSIVEADPKKMSVALHKKVVAVKSLAIGGHVAHTEHGKGIVISNDGKRVEVEFEDRTLCEFVLPSAIRTHEIEALDQKRASLPDSKMVQWTRFDV